MSLGNFNNRMTAKQAAYLRENARKELMQAEHEQHESLLSALRAFGAPLPPKEKMYELYFSDQKKGGGR